MAANARFGLKIAIAACLVLTFFFSVLVLVGCVSTSPGIPQLYLVQLNLDEEVFVNIGYFGICIVQSKTTSCAASAFSTGEQVQGKLLASVSTPISASFINLARQLQQSTFLGILSASGVILLGDTVFWALYASKAKKVEQRLETPRRVHMYRKVLIGLACIGSGLAFAAAWSITIAITALQQNSKSQVGRGTAVLALHWIAFAFSFLYALGISTTYGASTNNTGTAKETVKDTLMDLGEGGGGTASSGRVF